MIILIFLPACNFSLSIALYNIPLITKDAASPTDIIEHDVLQLLARYSVTATSMGCIKGSLGVSVLYLFFDADHDSGLVLIATLAAARSLYEVTEME